MKRNENKKTALIPRTHSAELRAHFGLVRFDKADVLKIHPPSLCAVPQVQLKSSALTKNLSEREDTLSDPFLLRCSSLQQRTLTKCANLELRPPCLDINSVNAQRRWCPFVLFFDNKAKFPSPFIHSQTQNVPDSVFRDNTKPIGSVQLTANPKHSLRPTDLPPSLGWKTPPLPSFCSLKLLLW